MLLKILAVISSVIALSDSAFAYEANEEDWGAVPSPSDISVYLYPLNSNRIDQLHEEMLHSGPKSGNGVSHYAAANWKVEWNWPLVGGKPSYRNTIWDLQLSLTLPFPVSKTLKESEKWNKLIKTIIRHELQHLEHGRNLLLEGVNLTNTFSAELDAKDANKKLKQVISHAKFKDSEYDKNTKHGLSEGITLKAE